MLSRKALPTGKCPGVKGSSTMVRNASVQAFVLSSSACRQAVLSKTTSKFVPAEVKSWAESTSHIQADPGLPTLDHTGTLLSFPRTQITPCSDLRPLPSSSLVPTPQLSAQQRDPTRPESSLHADGCTNHPRGAGHNPP